MHSGVAGRMLGAVAVVSFIVTAAPPSYAQTEPSDVAVSEPIPTETERQQPLDTAPTAPLPLPAPKPPRNDDKPLAGWHNGFFYIRDATDSFRFYPAGRLHVDGYAPFGAGVSKLPAGSAMNPTVFIRRARVEFNVEFKKWQGVVMAELGPTAIDNTNARGASSECAVDATTADRACAPRGSAVDAPAQRAAVVNAYINYAHAPWLNAQIGQFRIPFTLEHRTGINVLPFMDRSLAVRLIGPPTGRDIGAMVWGEGPRRYFHYAVAIMTGDGADRTNVDARFDGLGRVFVRPFVETSIEGLKDLQIGGSFRGGSRDGRLVGYDVAPLTTQGGYAYWRPTYRDAQGNLIHIIPSGAQLSYAAELYAPIGALDLITEIVVIDHHTREAPDALQFTPGSRLGSMTGIGHYVQLGYWLMGSRDVLPKPGYMGPPHLDFSRERVTPDHSLQVVAKVEQLRLEYRGSERRGAPDARNVDGDIRVDAISFGVSYFFTRHVRTTLNYVYYSFPDSAPVTPSQAGGPTQTSAQRAVAPGQGLDKGSDDTARDGAHALHELSARIAVQF
jgi:hypothetical protein